MQGNTKIGCLRRLRRLRNGGGKLPKIDKSEICDLKARRITDAQTINFSSKVPSKTLKRLKRS